MFVLTFRRTLEVFAVVTLMAVAGCSAPPQGEQFLDPYEEGNRKIHAVNRSLDSIFLRPGSKASGIVPEPAIKVVRNFSSNLDQPGIFVNDVLQGEVEDAGHNMFRFLVNSTLGLAGLFDPATSMGLEQRDTDFGETLHVWGAKEGAYLELPLYGPSTTRDAWGRVVDNALNPTKFVLGDQQKRHKRGANILSRFGQRAEMGDLADEVLYESADSYAQTRLLYLQNRRFELGGPVSDEDYFDPFEDFDAQ